MKLTAQYETDTDLFPEWPHGTTLVIGFDYIPEVIESHSLGGPPEDYDPGSNSEVYMNTIEIIGDEWFADKNVRDMFNVKQAIALEAYCDEQGRNYLQAMSERYEY